MDPAAIEEIQKWTWPDIRNKDELHDVLQTLIAVPAEENWVEYFAPLELTGRAGKALLAGKTFWVAVEKVRVFRQIYSEAILLTQLMDIELPKIESHTALIEMLRGWMLHLGPTTHQELCEKLLLGFSEVEQALLVLEATGLILRGNFRNLAKDNVEWCERRLLAKIHRLTLAKLRREIEPVTPLQFVRWLCAWQHIATGTQLQGEAGLLEIIRQLQGTEIPAKAWEKQIFAKRLKDYDPQILDRLCLMGIIGWGRRYSPKKINSTRAVPITFFVREDSIWRNGQALGEIENLPELSPVAKKLYSYLKQRGASFFADIARQVNHLQSEIERGLWELVAAGLITADSFDNLRALINPLRRAGKGRFSRAAPRLSGSRWAVLSPEETNDSKQQTEAICWTLLKRYGVVFRDLLARETNIPCWRELLPVFRRLEDCGEIRSGRFINSFTGEQFALLYAVESLRAMKNKPIMDEAIKIAASDPLNLRGIILPGKRVSPLSSKDLIFKPDGFLN